MTSLQCDFDCVGLDIASQRKPTWIIGGPSIPKILRAHYIKLQISLQQPILSSLLEVLHITY